MSSVPKQSSARPASRPQKGSGKSVTVTVKPVGSGSRRSTLTKRAAGKLPAVTPIEEDLTQYVPSKSVLARGLKLAKVDPAWIDDDYAPAKPKKK
jgi:hypothetical protein